MNGEINRLVHAFAGDHGLHATDVQAPAAILDAEVPSASRASSTGCRAACGR